MYPHWVGLMIGVPLTGRALVPQFTWAFLNLHPPMNYNMRYMNTWQMHVAEARQRIAEAAIAEKAKYLFFLGEDVVPPANTLRSLIFHMEHQPDLGVIGGIYCMKGENPAPMVFRGNGGGPYWDWKVGELFEISGIGMDCTLIRTEVFKDLEKPWFRTIDDMSAFMDNRMSAIQYTEDLWFCEKLCEVPKRDVNGQIIYDDKGDPVQKWRVYADGQVVADHYDMVTLQPYTLPKGCLPLRHLSMKKGTKKILDIGCGPLKYDTDEGEVVTVDILEQWHPDYRCDARLLPFDNKSFDIVYSSHCLEHFGRHEVSQVLDEWIRVMKDDGELRLVLPNLEWAAKQVLSGDWKPKIDPKEYDNILNVFYGQQDYGENYHQCGFTPATLEALLREKGFRHFAWNFSKDTDPNPFNMKCRATKTTPEELRPKEPETPAPEPEVAHTG